MTFGYVGKRAPKPEHITAAMEVLQTGEYLSPMQIAKLSNLSLTAVNCVLTKLEQDQKIDIIRQNISPKLRVRLKGVSKEEQNEQ